MRRLIGFAILITLDILPIVVMFVREIYLLVKSIKKGDDWKFYAENVLAFCTAFIGFVALLAMVL